MNQRAVANLAEIVSAEAKSAAHQVELAKLKETAGHWIINFQVDVETSGDGSYQIAITGQTGDKTFREVIPQKDALYHMADTIGTAQSISSDFVAALLNDLAAEALTPKLSKAFENLKTLAGHSGFAK